MNEKIKRHHHLVDHQNKFVYCYLAKNACSSLKYSFLKKLYIANNTEFTEDDLNKQVHKLSKKQALNYLNIERPVDYTYFTVLREPKKRITSAFLDKFVRMKTIPPFARELIESVGCKVNDFTFRDFIIYICTSDQTLLNEHWRSQTEHFYWDQKYRFVLQENLTNDFFIKNTFGKIGGNVRSHSINYISTSEIDCSTKLSDIRDFNKKNGTYPTLECLFNEELQALVEEAYNLDKLLYNKVKELGTGENGFTSSINEIFEG